MRDAKSALRLSEGLNMAPEANSLIDSLRQIVAAHYERDSSPLLLSDLGDTLRKRNLWPSVDADRKTLRQAIEEARDPNLLIVRDRNAPAYVAVTTEAAKKVVEQFIDRRAQTASAIPDLDALPRAVLLAFCVRPESGKTVFLRTVPPFKYEVAERIDEDSHHFFPVDERYRRPGLKLTDLSELSASDRLDLQTKIAAWSRDNGINLEDFYSFRKKHANALERLLAAQPREVASKIMIPGDIALILSRHE